jgi:hypothetical protein
MGSFSERGAWIEMVRVLGKCTWTSSAARARRLFVVLSGFGSADRKEVRCLTALDVEAGEMLTLNADETMELFLIGLPPIEPPAVESDNTMPKRCAPKTPSVNDDHPDSPQGDAPCIMGKLTPFHVRSQKLFTPGGWLAGVWEDALAIW